MKHLNEEELIEHYYKEDEAATRDHLESCADCTHVFAALESDLGEIDFVSPPKRDDGYGESVWEAISADLPRWNEPRRRWLPLGFAKGLSYAAACALLVVGAFYAGRVWEHKQTAVTAEKRPLPAQNPVHAPARVVVVVLSDHLDRSERLLVELKHADLDNSETLSPLRDEARSLLPANRICRQNAEKLDDPALETALQHLDDVLGKLANTQGRLSASELTQLQNEMNADGLLFQVRVLRNRVSSEQPKTAHSQGASI